MKTHLLATEILSSTSIEIHYLRPLFAKMIHITGVTDAVSSLREIINKQQIDYKEFFWVLLLNHSHRLLSIVEISSGNVSCTPVSTREVIQLALLKNASSVILSHNHPSGKLCFSQSDIEITKKLKEMCSLFSIRLIDHIVLTQESYKSMMEENIL